MMAWRMRPVAMTSRSILTIIPAVYTIPDASGNVNSGASGRRAEEAACAIGVEGWHGIPCGRPVTRMRERAAVGASHMVFSRR
jgi:hypothetical protein